MATRQIRLFAALAYETANESAKNSPLVLINDDGESDGPPFWTFSVIEDTRLIGELGLYAGRTTKLFRQRPALAQDAEAAVKEFLRSMRTANSKKSLDNRKGKERLLNLVTFPMVLCLGIPALRRRALTLRDEWYAAMLRHRDRHDHPQILRTEEAYDRALTGLMIFSVITADGLRLANYTGARLGHLGRERMVEDKAPDGTVIRSYCHIHPVLNASKNGLVGIETNFYGDDNPSVKLKIDKVPGSDEWRQHPHWLRPGIVDMELMWDYLTRTRAKRLAQQGLIASAEEYDIERDINEWHFALFISDTPSSSAYESATGAYTHQAVSDIYGRMLHWICTEVLGRELPEYGQQLKRLYRAVFSAHSSRLLAGTHLYGVLQRETEAATLLNDTRRMVERRYSVAEASMIHKRGWEHPRFFDDLFKRIWDENESVDWDLEDALKNIPAHDRPRPFESAA
jgi:hypothetical protein